MLKHVVRKNILFGYDLLRNEVDRIDITFVIKMMLHSLAFLLSSTYKKQIAFSNEFLLTKKLTIEYCAQVTVDIIINEFQTEAT